MSHYLRTSVRPLWSRRIACAAIAGGWLSLALAGDERDDAKTDQPADNPASAVQRQRMQQRVASLSMERGEKARQKIELAETALLRYSSPGSETTDGAVWAWGKSGRPVALSAIFFEELPTGDEKWSCELTMLTDEPLRLASRSGWKWTPAKSNLRWLPVPESAVVAETAGQRARQLKDLARQFAASETFGESRTDQLRLLIQPLHRYSDPDHDLLDGALFAFASGTNPEALLLLEARPDSRGTATWHFAFARMGAAACQARLDEKVVWECAAIKAWHNREPYYSVFGKDAAVFGKLDRE